MGMSFECGVCGLRRVFEGVIRRYDTPGEVAVIPWPCWCWQCSDVSLAEYIPSPAEILEEAKAWKERDRNREYRIRCGPLGRSDDEREEAALGYYDSVLAWRRQRRSRGRCLFCGSVMVSLSKSRYGKFEHPICGGMLWCVRSFALSISWIAKEIYSAEGVKLSEERVLA